MTNLPNGNLAETREALRALHHALLHAIARERESVFGPAPLLELATNDPLFAWVRPMSALLSDLDESERKRTPLDVAQTKRRVEALLAAEEFAAKYLPYIQNSHEVAATHALVRSALKRV